MNFESKFMRGFFNMLKEIKKHIKDTYDKNEKIEILRTPELKYIVSVKNDERLYLIEKIIKKYSIMNLYKFENNYIKALYIDSENGFNCIFLTVKEKYISIDSDKFNYGIDSKISVEFQESLRENEIKSLKNPNFDTTVNIIYAFELCISNYFDIKMKKLKYIKLSNTQKEIINAYTVYKNPENIRKYDWCIYDHIKSFSLNYYTIIKVIADVVRRNNIKKGIIIHDAGTSNSQFAMMVSILKEDELMNVNFSKIIASDLMLPHKESTEKYISNYPDSKPINFIKLDFTDESEIFPESDVTVLNDVLEHFENDKISFRVLERFWMDTKKLLIIHVPFEEKPSINWGHFITFNKEKLKKWATRLHGYVSLAEKYFYNENKSYNDNGFLILEKH